MKTADQKKNQPIITQKKPATGAEREKKSENTWQLVLLLHLIG